MVVFPYKQNYKLIITRSWLNYHTWLTTAYPLMPQGYKHNRWVKNSNEYNEEGEKTMVWDTPSLAIPLWLSNRYSCIIKFKKERE